VPGASIAFTTHEMSPASVLALVEELYNRSPEAYLLPVPGAAWDLVEGLSAEGSAALELAVQQLETFLEDRTKSRGALG
jgi:Ni,Fe-hydrogenase maturation factor